MPPYPLRPRVAPCPGHVDEIPPAAGGRPVGGYRPAGCAGSPTEREERRRLERKIPTAAVHARRRHARRRHAGRRHAGRCGPGGGGKMPSPEDLPPAQKEMMRVAILGGGPRARSPPSNWRRPESGFSCSTRSSPGKSPAAGVLRTRLQPVPLPDSELHAQAVHHRNRAGRSAAGAVSLMLDDPLLIYSRFDLNGMLLAAPSRRAHRSKRRASPK